MRLIYKYNLNILNIYIIQKQKFKNLLHRYQKVYNRWVYFLILCLWIYLKIS